MLRAEIGREPMEVANRAILMPWLDLIHSGAAIWANAVFDASIVFEEGFESFPVLGEVAVGFESYARFLKYFYGLGEPL